MVRSESHTKFYDRWYVASLIQNFTTKILIYNVYALDQNLIVVGSSSL